MQLKSATDRASLAEEQAALRREASLRRIATLVAGGVTAGELFSAVAREVSVVLDVPVVTVGRYEIDGRSPVSVVLASREHASFPVGSRWPLDGAGTREIYEDRRSIRIEDFSGLEGTLASAARQQGMNWVVGAPIIVDGAAWGNIYAGTTRDERLPEDAEAHLADFTDLVSTAIANSDAREKVHQLAEEQAALRRVAAIVAEGASSTAVFDAVAQEVAQLFQFTPTLVARYEDDGATMTVLAAHPASFKLGSRWPLDGPSVAAEVLRTGRPVRIEDWTDLPGTLAAVAREHGWTRVAGAPIIVDGRVWGLVATVGPPDERLPENLEDRLAEFTQLVGTAIANSQAHEELAQLADEQAALRRVATLVAQGASPDELFAAVAREVANLFGVGMVSIDRYENGESVVLASFDDPGFPVGSRWPLDGAGLRTMVYETERPARVDDFTGVAGAAPAAARASGIKSAIAAPIVVGGKVWGVLGFGWGEDDPLPAGTEQRLGAFTELVATAIANAESRGELAASEARARELANEQAALRRVATLVAQGASPDELFSAVAKEVRGVIDAPVVGINRYEADGTYTIVGNAGESSLWIGTRWPFAHEGVTGMILATGRPSRQDDFIGIRGTRGDPVPDALLGSWREARSVVGVPIFVEGSIWGVMSAVAEPGKLVPVGTEERLARFTELVATAVSNATTRTDLLTSRARLVSAADESRRRLERDLHDGIQQWLVALALRARKAAGLSAASESAAQELSGLADDLVAVTDGLRELSHGIHPAILSDAGLDDALKALARRSAIVVDLDVSFQRRYDPTVEATVYYVVAESITNAVKHAQAPMVTVRGGQRKGAIELEIRDDGVGGADPRHGTGLIGLKDRVDTLGGTISFASQAGSGTIIRVKLPVGPRDGDDAPHTRSDEAAAPASG